MPWALNRADARRWDCENLVLFTDRHSPDDTLELLTTERLRWAVEHRFLDEKAPEVMSALSAEDSDPARD
jgi:hypothetical protein